jgi:uncharacterized membrane protein YraQ (UPF0718 family)
LDAIIREVSSLLADMLGEIWFVLPYVLAGVAMEALVRTYGWHIRLRAYMGRHTHGAILIAVGIGMFSPLCACGILPMTVSMLMAGVPLPPAMALLVASPLMSPAGFTTTWQNLGPEWAIAKIIGSLFMGLFAGYATLFFERRGAFAAGLFRKAVPMGDFHDPDYPCEDLKCSCQKMFSKRYVDGRTKNKFLIFLGKFVDGLMKVGKFVVVGVVVEILVIRYLPLDWVLPFFTNASPLSIPLIALVSVPMHVNQITASFLLLGWQELLAEGGKTLARGPGLAFLIGGPVTALPVIAVFLAFFKRRVFFLYMGVCLVGTIGLAYAYQYLVP